MKRLSLAIILLAIGLFILLESSGLSSGFIVFDFAILVVGPLLAISYMSILAVLGATLFLGSGFFICKATKSR